MSEETALSGANFEETFNRLTGNVDRLESTLEQTLQALRKRGIQPSVDLTGMVRTVRRDLDAFNSIAVQSTSRLRQLQELVTAKVVEVRVLSSAP